MFDASRRHSATADLAGTGSAPVQLQRQESESAAGWVVAEITPYPRPLRLLSHSNAETVSNGFMAAGELLQESLEDFFAAQYAPPEAQFVLAVIERSRGQRERGYRRWSEVEIVLRSPQKWPVQLAAEGRESAAPHETPELRRLVEELAVEAMRQGWEPAGSGRTWCSLRFRQRSTR